MTKEEFIKIGISEDLASICEEKFSAEIQKQVKYIDDLENQVINLEIQKEKVANDNLEKIKKLKMEHCIQWAVKECKGKNITAIKSLLDFDNIYFDEHNNLIGLNEQLEHLSNDKSSSFLFEKEKNSNSFIGIKPCNTNFSNKKNLDFSNMSYSEQVKFLKENPNFNISN